MPIIPSLGTSSQTSDIAFLLQDQLNAMGDFLTQEEGSLNWCEAYCNARALSTCKNYLSLLANQLSPNSSSIFLYRWAQIYNVLGISSYKAIQDYVEFKQSEFGTPPTLTNLNSFLENKLGSIFINLQWAPELQPFATNDPVNQISQDGYPYNAPLNNVFIYVWQPRDNKDNLLMPNSIFNNTVETYRQIIEPWNPSYISFTTMNLTNQGFQDGYANNYNGLNYNNYLDGYNVVSGLAGSNTLTGIGTAFKSYPNGSYGDFILAVNENYYPPIQIVDDNNALQTYYVLAVNSNTSLTLTSNLINNITNRTYRCLGFCFDSQNLDSSLFNE
jgi:hypothetical protein